jgi:hypothetical protein
MNHSTGSYKLYIMKNENVDRAVLLILLLIAACTVGYLIGVNKNNSKSTNSVTDEVKIDTSFSHLPVAAKAHYADSVAASNGH